MKNVNGMVAIVGIGVLLITGCSPQQSATAGQQTAEQKAQQAEAARKAEINMRTDQINHSNLPPDQKQRLLQQISAPAGK